MPKCTTSLPPPRCQRLPSLSLKAAWHDNLCDDDDDDDDCVAGSELLLKIEIYCYKTALNKETFAQTRINNWLSVQTLQFLKSFWSFILQDVFGITRNFFGVTLWSCCWSELWSFVLSHHLSVAAMFWGYLRLHSICSSNCQYQSQTGMILPLECGNVDLMLITYLTLKSASL